MSFLNNNNFCRWGDVIHENPQMDESATPTVLEDWTPDDIAPIGDNESEWSYIGGYAAIINGATESTKGLSQIVSIQEGRKYMINWTLKENLYGDTDFYLYAISGDLATQILVERIGGTGDVIFQYEFEADRNYNKILACAVAVSGSGISAYIKNLLFTDIGSCNYAAPLLKGDTLSIFGNVELDDSVIAFSGLKLGLWKIDEGLYLQDISSLNQNVISGNLYSFYVDEWSVPVLPKGLFSFVLYDDTNYGVETMIYYWSNVFNKRSVTGLTSMIKYRNSADTLGYQYASYPSFYNQFRVDLWAGRSNFPENITGYETYNGGFIKTKSDITKLREFETRFFDEGAHEAFAAMLAHSEVLIDDVEHKKTNDGDYSISWSDDDDNKIGNGSVNLLIVDYSSAIKIC